MKTQQKTIDLEALSNEELKKYELEIFRAMKKNDPGDMLTEELFVSIELGETWDKEAALHFLANYGTLIDIDFQ
jgi:hypothetical protein